MIIECFAVFGHNYPLLDWGRVNHTIVVDRAQRGTVKVRVYISVFLSPVNIKVRVRNRYILSRSLATQMFMNAWTTLGPASKSECKKLCIILHHKLDQLQKPHSFAELV